MKYCGKCGTQLEDSMRFCLNCGLDLDAVASSELPLSTQSPAPVSTYTPTTSPPTTEWSLSDKLIFATFALGIVGLIIAANTDDFGIGELLVFASIGTGVATKKVGIIVCVVIMCFILGIIWFGW